MRFESLETRSLLSITAAAVLSNATSLDLNFQAAQNFLDMSPLGQGSASPYRVSSTDDVTEVPIGLRKDQVSPDIFRHKSDEKFPKITSESPILCGVLKENRLDEVLYRRDSSQKFSVCIFRHSRFRL